MPCRTGECPLRPFTFALRDGTIVRFSQNDALLTPVEIPRTAFPQFAGSTDGPYRGAAVGQLGRKERGAQFVRRRQSLRPVDSQEVEDENQAG